MSIHIIQVLTYVLNIRIIQRMREIAPLKKIKVSDEVTQTLEKIIIDNDLQPGDKLPSQSELAESLHVGSRSIREAVRSLESRGLVETKQGKGIFVKNNNLDFFLETLKDNLVFQLPKETKTLIDLANIRMMVETDAIQKIALNTPPGFISSFALILDKMDSLAEKNDIEAYNILDVELHKTLIKATGNTIVISIYNHLFELLIRSFQKTGGMKGSKETSRREHRQMLEVITASDGERARAIMEQHIGSTLRKLEAMESAASAGSES